MVVILGKQKRKVILAIIVLASIFATILIYPYFYPADVKEIDIYLKVSNYTGFNVNTSAVFFGTIIPSGMASRDIIVTNEDAEAHKVNIKIQGELNNWITISENGFSLESEQNRTIKLTLSVPYNAEYGNYTSKVKIIFK